MKVELSKDRKCFNIISPFRSEGFVPGQRNQVKGNLETEKLKARKTQWAC